MSVFKFLLVFIFVIQFYYVDSKRNHLDYKYHVYQELVTYDAAVKYCKAKGMVLLSIENKEKNEEVLKYVNSLGFWLWPPFKKYKKFCDFHFVDWKDKNHRFWTSGKYDADAKKYKWVNGNEFTYFNWNKHKKEINGCVQISNTIDGTNLYWDVLDCNSINAAICEDISKRFEYSTMPKQKCVHFSTTRMTYQQSLQYCEQLDLEELIVADFQKNILIEPILTTSGKAYTHNVDNPEKVLRLRFWTSAIKYTDFKKYRWISGEELVYSNFEPIDYVSTGENSIYIAISRNSTGIKFGNKALNTDQLAVACEVPKERFFHSGVPKKYYFSNEKATYYLADQICKSKEMHLLSIHDSDKNENVKNSFPNGFQNVRYWTSGSRIPDTNIWLWHKTIVAVTFHWEPDTTPEPKSNKNCIAVFKTADEIYWVEEFCQHENYFICENDYPPVNMYCLRYQ